MRLVCAFAFRSMSLERALTVGRRGKLTRAEGAGTPRMALRGVRAHAKPSPGTRPFVRAAISEAPLTTPSILFRANT